MAAQPKRTTPPARTDDRQHVLARENARLRKINRVLMDRVERSMDVQGSAFSLFQTSVMLGQVVRDRTAELAKALSDLSVSNRELTALNEQLRQEIAERDAAEVALREAKNEAERANLSKTKFLAATSHDLQQPLNAARLFTAALLEARLSAPDLRLVHSVNSALEAVDGMLNALLDMSKLDAGVVTAEIGNFAADRLLSGLAAEYASVAASRQIGFRFVRCDATLRTDPQLLSRIIRNFLSNAIRYTPHGRILLGCRHRAGVVQVGVWDTGPGIPDDKLETIFEEFQRIGQPQSDRERGLGLGLAIVDRIARILGHRVQVRSCPGRGSAFTVDVPLADEVVYRGRASQPVDSAILGTSLAGTAVLVIDDDPSIGAAMEALLGSWACRVVSATSSAEALARLRVSSTTVDLVIADYHLADGPTGIDAIEAVQGVLSAQVPAMVITADHSAEILRDLRLRGYPVLGKPVKPAQLRAMLIHLLSSAAEDREPTPSTGSGRRRQSSRAPGCAH